MQDALEGVRAGLHRGAMRARFAWYAGQYVLAARLSPPMDLPKSDTPLPGFAAIMADLDTLFAQDRDQARAGLHAGPEALAPNPLRAARNAIAFLADLPAVNRRRAGRVNDEVFAEPYRGRYPRYYLQNFHYQSGGYLTEGSAALYDHQVEVLFTGGADAMRRQALPALGRAWAGLGRRTRPRHLDVACGTGRFLRDLKRSNPRVALTGLDLSEPYLGQAAKALAPWRSSTTLVQGLAERLPFGDEAFDTLSSIYLFHELPRKIRVQAAREFRRVLKPGGLMVFVDSIQRGDHAPYDPLLDRFPVAFHEPYYAEYVDSDLEALFAEAGLQTEAVERAFFSRVMTLRAV